MDFLALLLTLRPGKTKVHLASYLSPRVATCQRLGRCLKTGHKYRAISQILFQPFAWADYKFFRAETKSYTVLLHQDPSQFWGQVVLVWSKRMIISGLWLATGVGFTATCLLLLLSGRTGQSFPRYGQFTALSLSQGLTHTLLARTHWGSKSVTDDKCVTGKSIINQ